ncbi:uncharacterized protein LOC105684808 isoform X4 [Athalia rosae]|uniref:uncharacterized protein LOC105684808 isoform X4 n=1 Tax=Athalia rosae TaxID=37344 RepID=UPI002033EE19|nr:uncharacterized protein LOC105684808 isoform X4 [Athalia rosae]
MVEILRDQWCIDLEDLLQCPICYERPKVPVLQCKRGHHICNVCKNQMAECPLCKSEFSTARNYLAEELSVKLDAIKVSLQYPTHNINKKRLPSVGSQTDARGSGVGSTTVDDSKRAKRRPLPPAPKGKFPCRLGACDVTIPHGRMIPHIRYYHNNKFYEMNTVICLELYRSSILVKLAKSLNMNSRFMAVEEATASRIMYVHVALILYTCSVLWTA